MGGWYLIGVFRLKQVHEHSRLPFLALDSHPASPWNFSLPQPFLPTLEPSSPLGRAENLPKATASPNFIHSSLLQKEGEGVISNLSAHGSTLSHSSLCDGCGLHDSSAERAPYCPCACGPRRHIDLQPWAGPAQSLDEEALRFLSYISTTQIACKRMNTDGLAPNSSPARKPWSVCLDDRFGLTRQIHNKQCRLYSLGLGNDDTHFEVSMAKDGCEVHRFDPSVKSPHILESQRLWHHRLSIDWRDPHPAVAAQRPHRNTRKLGSILNEFGHHKIDVLKADLESAEWKVLENLILEDVLEHIGQLIFEIHLHWPGFEVSGGDNSVVRFWYSLLKELERKDFRLFHSYKDLSKPQLFLKKEIFNASSCYTLSWVNTRWK
ncbi:methyltransferase-like protein 24 [Carlito syrichta]|uniref:Methyltransferase-like protein 24 n=1 Tax=Carlito syrichta TaxID=1868482 RepID=A0A3Q0EDR6_CARSF|nr:methyltransferase-like protein 24 [Carlito syrichta]